MMKQELQNSVIARIRSEGDPSKSWRANYESLYPDQVTPEQFLDCWTVARTTETPVNDDDSEAS